MGDEEEVQMLKERLKEIEAGIEFTQDGIEEAQQAIMQLEDTRVILYWNHSVNMFTLIHFAGWIRTN
jgi:uncharacterized 2Fe-2S/4Fe-4S cluster protein (DUF4445 family)